MEHTMASLGPEPGVVVQKKMSDKERRNKERLGLEYTITTCHSMMTVGLGRSVSGAPTLTSLYKPRNTEHKLARAKLFDQSAVKVRDLTLRSTHSIFNVMQAFDFIRRECEKAHVPEDIWLGIFEEHRKRFIRDNHLNADFHIVCLILFDSSEFKVSETYLMAYINLLEAAVLALEMEEAISMFAEDEQITTESLTLKLYFPFSDAMEQQDSIDKGVQHDLQTNCTGKNYPFMNSLTAPVTRRLLDFTSKLDLYGMRYGRYQSQKYLRLRNPFYSAKVFQRILKQTNAWFLAEEYRVWLARKKNEAEGNVKYFGIRHHTKFHADYSFYEENSMKWALAMRDTKEGHEFMIKAKENIFLLSGVPLEKFFFMFWELQERERQLSIVTKVEAWVKCQRKNDTGC